jgi:hypothetical protein
VVKELIDDLEEYWRSGGDAEEPRVLFDIFTYLCGIIVHTTFYDEIEGNDEDRIVSEDEWNNQVQLNKDEEELRQQRKTTNETK